MDLRNWEHNATSGTPIAGATVEARAASLTSPNTGPILASTTTNADGMWEFVGLADAAVDIKVTYTGNVWWHKGLTKHNVSAIFYSTPIVATDNFFKTAGFEVGSGGPYTVTSVDQGSILGSWRGINGAGSSATITRETITKSADSDVSAKIIQTRVAGSLLLYQNLPVGPAGARGKEMTATFQVHQSVAAAVRAYLSDSGGTTYSATSATIGAFVTLTVTRTINAAATHVQAGISIDVSATVYLDNGVWVIGAVAPSYRPEVWSAGNVTSELIADAAITDAKMATQKVNRSGDTMTGALTTGYPLTVQKFNDTGTGGRLILEPSADQRGAVIDVFNNVFRIFDTADVVPLLELNLNTNAFTLNGVGLALLTGATFTGAVSAVDNITVFNNDSAPGALRVVGPSGPSGYSQLHDDGTNIVLSTNAGQTVAFGRAPGAHGTIGGFTLWDSGNDGAASGLDADLLDGVQGSGYALVDRGVPAGAIVFFETLAELTAAGAGWSRYTAADGRLLVGAGGSASAQTFTEATNYGSTWTPASGVSANNGTLGVNAGTLGASSSAIEASLTASTNIGTGTLNAAYFAHSHPAPTITMSGAPALSGSVAIAGTGTVWLPYMRAGIWGRKS